MTFRAREQYLVSTDSENHSFIAVQKDAVFDVPADGAGEDDFFEVAAFTDKVFDSVAMRDANYILLDDGTIVEDFGDVMAGCADQFDAALEGLMVWARADKGGQK
jgi:hypothetical protein